MRDPNVRRLPAISRATGLDRRASVAHETPPNLKDLHEYQREAVHWLRGRDRGLLGDEMGLGKTVTVLRALRRRDRAVVVCPASLRLQWARQCERWRSDLRASLCETVRRPDEGEIVIVSYDSLPAPPQSSSLLVLEPMRDVTLILDECQMVKSEDARRTQRVRRLRAQCGRCWGLSGTPMTGVPPDLWGVLVSLGLSDIYADRKTFVQMCGGKEKWMFDKRLGRPRQIGYEWGEVSEEVRERLVTVMLRRRREDVLPDLAGAQYVDEPVDSPEDLREFLDEVTEAWDEVGPEDLPPFTLLSAAMAALARSKTGAAVEHTRIMAEQFPILVFSAHRDPVLEVARSVRGTRYFVGESSERERDDAVRAFMAGEARVLATTIQCGGAGLNLQVAGGILFVDRSYTPGENDQAVARAVRPGQTRSSVLVKRLISDHPLDRRLSEILDSKERGIRAAVG